MAVAGASDFQAAVIPAVVAILAATQAAGILAEAILAVEVVIRVAGIQVADIRAVAIRVDPVILRQEALPTTIVERHRQVGGARNR